MITAKTTIGSTLAFALALVALAPRADADADDPPSRVARVSYTQGAVSFQPAGTQDWVAAPLNRPLTTGDTLWSDQDSRVELELDGSVIRLSSASELSFVNLGDEVTQVQLTSGTLLLRVRRLDDDETYEVDTPNLAFSVLRPGLYRVSVDSSGNTTAITVRGGQGEVSGAGSAYTIYAGESDFFSGIDQLTADAGPAPQVEDALDSWGAERDSRWDRSQSTRYVSPDVVGYEDLDEYGSWRATPDYGPVWYPSAIAVGWAPYHTGHWAYIAPWGYTWVDDQLWGFAPFHYGRWVWGGGAWGWVPTPRRPERGPYIRPVYAPALVAWVGAGAGIAWFALGPREVYVPSYSVSHNYVRNINVSNTTVNTTVVNNVYNTTIINNKTVNVTYINRAVPGAVTATSMQAFSTAQPVARNLVKVDQHAIADAQVRALAPAVVPSKQAVLGPTRVTLAKPPAAVQTRTVVARTAPPAPALPFERRQEAIENNGGKPLSGVQVRQIQPVTAAPRTTTIRIAPPASPVRVSKTPARPLPPSTEASRVDRPPVRPPTAPSAQRTGPAPAVIHPSELPATPKPGSPSIANSAMERVHLQQQLELRAQQDQERQRVQQQQELEHQQLAKQQADEAKKQELERQHQQQALQAQQRQQELEHQQLAKEQADEARKQELEREHQQQTQQLQQKHIDEQAQLEAKQQEQKRAVKANEMRKPP